MSLTLNAFMFGILFFALVKYYLTPNNVIDGNQKAWVSLAILWPTFMLLGIATVTFCMNLVILCSYVCGVGAANKAQTDTTLTDVILLAPHVVFWAVVAGLFRMAETETDPWGYTCSSRADEIQVKAKSFVNFGKLCNLQVSYTSPNISYPRYKRLTTTQAGAWYASIVQAIPHIRYQFSCASEDVA